MVATEEITEDMRPYQGYGAARELFRSRDEKVVIEGPAGTGKSRGALEKMHAACEKYAGIRCLIVRQTRESMTESVLVTFEEKVVPVGHAILKGASRRMRQSYTYTNGSTIVLGGLDKPGKMMSTEYDMIAVFEATETIEGAIEQLTTRLRNGKMPYQQIILDCNPDATTHWINRSCDQGTMTRLLSRHEDNPRFFRNGEWTDEGRRYISKLDALTGHRKARLRHGKWANAEGAVYPGFDRAIHVIPSFDIPDDWRRFRVIDFGYKNPFVCQWWALDEDERAYMYREIYMTQRIVADHAKQIRELSEGERFEANIADHDAEDRATLEIERIGTIPARKEISPGINAVEARLRVQPDGKPRLFYFADALVERDASLDDAKRPCSTIAEYDAYIWKKSADGKPVKDEPHKEFDHGMDATRYFVMHLDGGFQFDFRVIDASSKPQKPPPIPANETPDSRFVREVNDSRMWTEVEV